MHSMILAEKAIDGRPTELYYIVYWKGKIHAKATLKSIKEITHLRQLLKKYLAKNPEKPTATSLPIDKGASPPLMAAKSGVKFALSITLHKRAPMKNS